MNGEDSECSRSRWGLTSGWSAWGLLTLAVVAVLPLFAWVGHERYGAQGVAAACVAAAVCWLSASLALVATVRLGSGPNAVAGVLLGMLIRMAIPLAVGIALDSRGGWLAEGKVFGQIVGFYLVVLAVETVLLARLFANAPSKARVW